MGNELNSALSLNRLPFICCNPFPSGGKLPLLDFKVISACNRLLLDILSINLIVLSDHLRGSGWGYYKDRFNS
ncbi:hypothetical protein Cycma_0934 [Cyclobacterium marinum DSM 745]|uniref:Uncharacterized protein n=1 Tax=Cyclobacterium marinum (strain ATCC 25205 / DSM 745 / LMG 13164 / NCIMB 1802) TaxID=880070 RepID=G0J4P1_CYCMS|nr:hypothetical protein Cycma_0934 [Cyclobacterium marinum DSM 745]